MMRIFTFLVYFCLGTSLWGQNFHFKVTFSQKDTTSFLSTGTDQYLSPRAIDRKNGKNISITISDFPISSTYIDTLNQYGTVLSRSKWLNAAIVGVTDSSSISALRNLSFVKEVKLIGQSNLAIARVSKKNEVSSLNYGNSEEGINQMNGQFLHDQGYLGQGKLIAVLDAGFVNVNTLSIFDSLRQGNQIVTTKNFVSEGISVYTADNHGTQVLSVLAANKSGEMIGSAPKSEYALLLTEDVREENPIEEYYWIEGVEYADSLGADVINSSLGYNTFDFGAFNHGSNELFTSSADISIVADLAWDKGILVVNAAGNEGKESWKKVLFPADATKILTVGGVDINGLKADFSSIGCSESSVLKPNVSALAVSVGTNASDGLMAKSNGTSFACPLVAGLSTCLWQQFPALTNDEIKQLIEQSSSQHSQPDHFLGHGIPNFELASNQLSSSFEDTPPIALTCFPNPVKAGEVITIQNSTISGSIKLKLYNTAGQLVQANQVFTLLESAPLTLQTAPLNKGWYILEISSDSSIRRTQICVL